MAEIYPPGEDSYLIEKYVKKLAYGKCLDVGTGSGILAVAALNNSDKVDAVDLNPKAIEYCRINHPKIRFFVSDLFSNVDDKYDFISFNSPYLPSDERVKDIALDGGEQGWEVSVEFFKQAKDYLNENGIIVYLFSSLTNKEKIDSSLKELGYRFEELEKLDLPFFEKLYVYKISKK